MKNGIWNKSRCRKSRKALNDEDYKELLAQGKELGLWAKDGEDKDAKYRANLPLVDEGRDAVNQAFVRGDFDKTTRDALLKDINEKEKNATAAWEAGLKLRMSRNEVVDVDKELANAPYPALATEKVDGLRKYQDEIAKKTEEEKKAEQEKQKAEKEKLDKAVKSRFFGEYAGEFATGMAEFCKKIRDR